MNPITVEWVAKAESDFRNASWHLTSGGPPAHDLICFLAQQCAEKYLKACLQEADVRFPKVHDLPPLLDLMPQVPAALTQLRPQLRKLSELAIDVRYPGYFADDAKARQAMETAAEVRRICRMELGLGPDPQSQP